MNEIEVQRKILDLYAKYINAERMLKSNFWPLCERFTVDNKIDYSYVDSFIDNILDMNDMSYLLGFEPIKFKDKDIPMRDNIIRKIREEISQKEVYLEGMRSVEDNIFKVYKENAKGSDNFIDSIMYINLRSKKNKFIKDIENMDLRDVYIYYDNFIKEEHSVALVCYNSKRMSSVIDLKNKFENEFRFHDEGEKVSLMELSRIRQNPDKIMIGSAINNIITMSDVERHINTKEYVKPLNKENFDSINEDDIRKRIKFIIDMISDMTERYAFANDFKIDKDIMRDTGYVKVFLHSYQNSSYYDKEIDLYEDGFPIDFLFSDDFIKDIPVELSKWKEQTYQMYDAMRL